MKMFAQNQKFQINSQLSKKSKKNELKMLFMVESIEYY